MPPSIEIFGRYFLMDSFQYEEKASQKFLLLAFEGVDTWEDHFPWLVVLLKNARTLRHTNSMSRLSGML